MEIGDQTAPTLVLVKMAVGVNLTPENVSVLQAGKASTVKKTATKTTMALIAFQNALAELVNVATTSLENAFLAPRVLMEPVVQKLVTVPTMELLCVFIPPDNVFALQTGMANVVNGIVLLGLLMKYAIQPP